MATITTEADVDIDIEDYLDEVSEDALLNELVKRKLKITDEDLIKNYIPEDLQGDKLKRYLCDILNSSYAISEENLLTQLKEKLNN